MSDLTQAMCKVREIEWKQQGRVDTFMHDYQGNVGNWTFMEGLNRITCCKDDRVIVDAPADDFWEAEQVVRFFEDRADFKAQCVGHEHFDITSLRGSLRNVPEPEGGWIRGWR